MRYEIQLVEALGPLLIAALADIDAIQVSHQTQLTISGPERLSPQSLLKLYQFGLDIEAIRCRDVDPITRRG